MLSGDAQHPGQPLRWLTVLGKWLSNPVFAYVVLALGCIANLGALGVGWTMDDWLHQLYQAPYDQLEGLQSQPWDLFVFANGDPQRNQALIDSGIFPWWAHSEAKLAFFRPLSVFFHRLDYWLWPNHPELMYTHSLVWLLAATALTFFCARRWLGDTVANHGLSVAGLSLWLFALDDARGPAVGWIANRNALIALTLGLGTMLVYRRAQQADARKWDTKIAWILWLFTLLAGESGIAALGFLVGHALFLESEPPLKRLLRLAPYLAIFCLYLLLYSALGYGSASSDFYLSPLTRPGGFLAACLVRVPIILGALFGGGWSDLPAGLSVIYPGSAIYWSLGLALVFALVAWLAWPYWASQAAAKAMACGTALSVLLAACTFPADRSLGFAGVGASSLLAIYFWQALHHRGLPLLRRLALWLLIIVHAVVAPAWLPARARSMEYASRPIQHIHRSLPQGQALVDHTMVLLNPPTDPQAAFFTLYRLSKGYTTARSIRWLSSGTTALTVERVDPHTLRLTPDEGFLPRMSERMLRSIAQPFRIGEQIRTKGLRMTIDQITNDGRPAQVRMRFDRPLEDPHYLWARWNGHSFVPYHPPQIGAPDRLAATDIQSIFRELPKAPPVPPTLEDWHAKAQRISLPRQLP